MLKGLICAGGHGTRLMPLTKVTNKHLLPVYDKPMIYYPLMTLIAAGIKDILIVSGKEHAGDFLNLLGSGKDFSVKLSYELQEEAGGIAQVVGLSESFTGKNELMVVLGDNIFEDLVSVKKAAEEFLKNPSGAKIFLKEVPDPERFGVAEVKGEKIINIIEKPKNPKSNLCVTGLYIYDNSVFNKIRTLKPSGRGELEITDVNNAYVNEGKMRFQEVTGDWTDAGTFETLLRANMLAAEKIAKQSKI